MPDPLLDIYNQQAAWSWEAEPGAEGFVLSDEMPSFPGDLRLPLIDAARLEPDSAEVELMRQRLATPLVDEWWAAADELGICGALGDVKSGLQGASAATRPGTRLDQPSHPEPLAQPQAVRPSSAFPTRGQR